MPAPCWDHSKELAFDINTVLHSQIGHMHPDDSSQPPESSAECERSRPRTRSPLPERVNEVLPTGCANRAE